MHFSPLVGLYEIQKVKFKPQVYEQSPEGIKRSNKLAVKLKKKMITARILQLLIYLGKLVHWTASTVIFRC